MRAQQFALAIGIALLLPLIAYCAVELFCPPANRALIYAQHLDFDQRLNKAKSKVQKESILRERRSVRQDIQRQDKSNQNAHFYLSYAMGVLTIVLSALVTVRSIANGLMFGGLFSITNSYANWDTMQGGLRFDSLLLALALLIALGYWKFRPVYPGPASPVTAV